MPGARVLRFRRQIDRQRRLVGVVGAQGAGRAVRPEQFRRRIVHRGESSPVRSVRCQPPQANASALIGVGMNFTICHTRIAESEIHPDPDFYPVFRIPAATPLTVTRKALRSRSSLPAWRRRWSSSTCTRLIGSTYGFRTSIDRRSTGLSSSSSRRPATASTAADVFGSRSREVLAEGVKIGRAPARPRSARRCRASALARTISIRSSVDRKNGHAAIHRAQLVAASVLERLGERFADAKPGGQHQARLRPRKDPRDRAQRFDAAARSPARRPAGDRQVLELHLGRRRAEVLDEARRLVDDRPIRRLARSRRARPSACARPAREAPAAPASRRALRSCRAPASAGRGPEARTSPASSRPAR